LKDGTADVEKKLDNVSNFLENNFVKVNKDSVETAM